MSYTVALAHAPNPDVKGGYWTPPVDDGQLHRKKCLSLRLCVEVARAYINRNRLGGANWHGAPGAGEVRKDGKTVAWISANGRVWAHNPAHDRVGTLDTWHNVELDKDTGEPVKEDV